jgi:hypothetical protein
MKSAKTAPVLDRLVDPLGECLTPDTEQEVGANVEHLQSASRTRVDPGVSFPAHHQRRLVLCLVFNGAVDWQSTV